MFYTFLFASQFQLYNDNQSTRMKNAEDCHAIKDKASSALSRDCKRITRSDNKIYSSTAKLSTYAANHYSARQSSGNNVQKRIPKWVKLISYEDKFQHHELNSGNPYRSRADIPESVLKIQEQNLLEEEQAFRTKGFLFCSNIVDQVHRNLLKNENMFQKDTLMPLCQFLDSFIPTRISCAKTIRKRRKLNEGEPVLLKASTLRYDPTNLPLVIISKSSSDILDRAHLVQYVANTLRLETKLSRPDYNMKTAVCIINGNRINMRKNHVPLKDYLYHILLQCLSLEQLEVKQQCSASSLRTKMWKSAIVTAQLKLARRSNITAIDTLVHWAKNTECFDSITVLLEDPESLSLATLDELIETLSNIRFFHHIPISLILTPIVGGQISMLSRSSLNNVIIKELVAPDSEILFNNLMNELFVDSSKEGGDILPVIFGSDMLQKIEHMFRHYHFSVSITAMHIKNTISIFFSRKGSILASLMSADFTSQYETQSQLLVVEKKLRYMLTLDNDNRTHEESPPVISRKDLISQMRIMHERTRSLNISVGLIKITLDTLCPYESVSAHVLLASSLRQSYSTEEVIQKLKCRLVIKLLSFNNILELCKNWKFIITRKLQQYMILDQKRKGEFEALRDIPYERTPIVIDETKARDNRMEKNVEDGISPTKVIRYQDDGAINIDDVHQSYSASKKASILLECINECILVLYPFTHKKTHANLMKSLEGDEEFPVVTSELAMYLNGVFARVINYIIDAHLNWFNDANAEEFNTNKIDLSNQGLDTKPKKSARNDNLFHQIIFSEKEILSDERNDLMKHCPIMAYPRQNVSFGLMNQLYVLDCQNCDDKSDHSQVHDTCVAYQLFTERHISQTDWYKLFCSNVNDLDGYEKFDRFVSSVYELLHCGVVKRDRVRTIGTGSGSAAGKSEEVYYEKMMVWLNGL